jgi:hypothetical protein
MEWIHRQLSEGYELIGDVDGHIVRLFIRHPKGNKIIKTKHMTQIDIDSCNLDDIRRYFSRHVDSIQSKTPQQLQILCN